MRRFRGKGEGGGGAVAGEKTEDATCLKRGTGNEKSVLPCARGESEYDGDDSVCGDRWSVCSGGAERRRRRRMTGKEERGVELQLPLETKET